MVGDAEADAGEPAGLARDRTGRGVAGVGGSSYKPPSSAGVTTAAAAADGLPRCLPVCTNFGIDVGSCFGGVNAMCISLSDCKIECAAGTFVLLMSSI